MRFDSQREERAARQMTARDIGKVVLVDSSILTVTGGSGEGTGGGLSVAATGLQGGCWEVAWGREEGGGRKRQKGGWRRS